MQIANAKQDGKGIGDAEIECGYLFWRSYVCSAEVDFDR